MSVQQEQHERWVGVRERLGAPVALPKEPPVKRTARERMSAIVARAGDAPQSPRLTFTAPAMNTPLWKIIALEVCRKHELSLVDLLSPRRDRPSVLARHEAFWRCKQETTLSLPQIGRRFGDRDHTTVLHGIKKHKQRMAAAQ